MSGGRRDNETDLRTLQRHVHEHAIYQERVKWFRRVFPNLTRCDMAWLYCNDLRSTVTYRRMTALAFQVMVNETLRVKGLPLTKRWRGE
jgi:hypothetical protein